MPSERPEQPADNLVQRLDSPHSGTEDLVQLLDSPLDGCDPILEATKAILNVGVRTLGLMHFFSEVTDLILKRLDSISKIGCGSIGVGFVH